MRRYKYNKHQNITTILKTGHISNPDVPSYIVLDTFEGNPFVIGTKPDLTWDTDIDINELIKGEQYTGKWYVSSIHMSPYEVEYYKILGISTNEKDHQYYKYYNCEFISDVGDIAELSIKFDEYKPAIIVPLIDELNIPNDYFDLTCPDKKYFKRQDNLFLLVSTSGNEYPFSEIVYDEDEEVEFPKIFLHIKEKNIY